MTEIPLANSKGVAMVDECDGESVNQFRWYLTKAKPVGKKFYAHAHFWVGSKFKSIFMHRFLLSPLANRKIDHINNNGLDNRRCNLRICTTRQNQGNLFSVGGTSKYKGVCRHQRRWLARIKHNRVTLHLGRFINETDAALAYDCAARKTFGEFARLNFPATNERSAAIAQDQFRGA